jgi:hypothetical protein
MVLRRRFLPPVDSISTIQRHALAFIMHFAQGILRPRMVSFSGGKEFRQGRLIIARLIG